MYIFFECRYTLLGHIYIFFFRSGICIYIYIFITAIAVVKCQSLTRRLIKILYVYAKMQVN